MRAKSSSGFLYDLACVPAACHSGRDDGHGRSQKAAAENPALNMNPDRVLAEVLCNHPTLTEQEAREMLKEAGL
jgi:hypothetical protein